jgi:MFS family permease
MMVELTGSSFLAALVQTAVFLPMFLFSLPAGVLADITDRRRLILMALACRRPRSRCWRCCCWPAGPVRHICCS